MSISATSPAKHSPAYLAGLAMSRRAFTRGAACALGLSLAGGAVAVRPLLASEAAEPVEQTYVPGTYTGTAVGNGGDIVVEVTFSEHAIEDIQIVSQSETPTVAAGALEVLPGRVLEAQSLGVDLMTGATISSAGFLGAVSDAAEQAGADVSALWASVPKTLSTEVVDLEADVAVVGAGAAGMSCALRACELGKRVVLVEKTYRLGGCISVSGGNQVVTCSQLQVEAGVDDDSAESMVEDFQANGEDICVPELIDLYAQNVGQATDWLNQTCGVEYNMEGGLHDLAEYSHNRELAYLNGGAGATETLRADIATSDIEVLTLTSLTELVVEDGAVTGLVAVSEDGTTYQVHAGSVVLATGGYGNSTRWLTEELLEDSLYYGLTTSTGDGLSVAVDDVDAATRMIEYAKLYPNGVEVSEHRAKSTIDGNLVVWPMSTILVSPEGERVVNEKASNHDILEVELQQTGSMLFLLMDAANYEAWSAKLPGTGFNMDLVAQWLEENGESTPIFAHGETLEDLAGRVGIDPEVLVTTVEDYNAGVRAGADEFGRSGDYLQMEIGDGPYYMVEQKPRYATTMGGLVINDALEVQSADGASIAGLYAAGEVVGGVMGSNSPSGANNAWAITSGKLAAESACA
jgi:fumarate reductase flavoprotein subunit